MIKGAAYYDEGSYVAEVLGQGLGKAKTGTMQFVLGIRILGRPRTDGDIDLAPQKYTRTIYMYFTEASISFVVEALRALGYTEDSFGPLDPGHPQHQSFVGQQIDVYCKHEIDQAGEVREKWSVSRGMPGVITEPLNAKEVRELDALFGKALRPPAGPAKGIPQNAPKKPASGRPSIKEPPYQEPAPIEAYAADATEIQEESDPVPF